jgi:hypothetical protein
MGRAWADSRMEGMASQARHQAEELGMVEAELVAVKVVLALIPSFRVALAVLH